MRRPPATIWISAACVFLAATTGCVRSSTPVSGAVTYGGKPLPNGTITFAPIAGTEAPTTMAAIVDGKYGLGQARALPAGTYRVSITAVRSRAGAGVAPSATNDKAPPPDPATEQQYIPAKYNARSELTITLDAGSGDAVRDFDLTD